MLFKVDRDCFKAKPHPASETQILRQQGRFLGKLGICDHGVGCVTCCWEWQGTRDKSGYGRTRFVIAGTTDVYAHRVAWNLFMGRPAKKLHVCHSCDNPPCCNPSHLWLGTHRQNLDDMMAKGRKPEGVRHTIKLSQRKADEIRRLWRTNEWSQHGLASRYGVSQPMIWAIVSDKAWRKQSW